jgi:hypothetical protein
MTAQQLNTEFSPDRLMRYTLWRQWDYLSDAAKRYAMFIGLNPSTADETHDDPTVRRCIDFAKRWGCGALCMTNLFAFRATDPRKMMGYPRPIGEENDKWLVRCSREATFVVAAWGCHGRFMARDEDVMKLLDNVQCLGVNADGTPRHPLYVRRDRELIDYGVTP